MKEKNNLFKLAFILLVVILFNFKFFPYNYPTDIYNILVQGYKEYANTWFASSGRTFCICAFYLANLMNIHINIFICISKVLSIIFAVCAIFIFYDVIQKAIPNNDEIKKWGILLASLVTFLNFSTYQMFYYTESGVMMLGILFVVLAIKAHEDDSLNSKYIKIFILLFLSINCYQSDVLFYIPAIILIQFLKQRKIKDISKTIIINGLILGADLLLGFIIIIVFRKIFNCTPYISAKMGFVLKEFIGHTLNLLRNGCDNFPNVYITLINYFILITVVVKITIGGKNDFKKIIPVIIIFVASSMEVIIMVSFMRFYLADRIEFAFVATVGLNFCYTISLLDRKLSKILINLCILVWLIINVHNSYNLTNWSKIARAKDKEYGKIISNYIEKYENDNNISLKKIEYCYDDESQRCDKGVRMTQETTCRGFFGDWVLDNTFNYYCPNHNFTQVRNQKLHKDVFKGKNWDEFSLEQIKFNEDTIYFCIY